MLFGALWKLFSDTRSTDLLASQILEHKWWFVLVVLMIPLNWFLETAKWKLLISVSEEISWKEAWSGVLSGLAIGAATPNRIGEFAGRVFQLKKTAVYDGISCTLISSLAQVGVTIVAGMSAILMVDTSLIIHQAQAIAWASAFLIVVIVGLIIVRSLRGKFEKYVLVLRKMEVVLLLKVFFLSLLRYLVYSTQFWLILQIFGIDAPSMDLYAAIAIHYLVVSIIPSVMISELFVRGAVASGVIGALCGYPEIAALAAVFTWLLNIGLPSLCGMFFVHKLNFFNRTI